MPEPPADELADALRDARDPTTSPTRLTRLLEIAQRYDTRYYLRAREVVGAVLAHPNAPPTLILETCRQWRTSVPALLANPVLPLLALETPEFFEQMHKDDVLRLLIQEDAPLCVIRVCRRHPEPIVSDAAEHHIALTGEADPESPEWREEVKRRLASPQPFERPPGLDLTDIPPFLRNHRRAESKAFVAPKGCPLAELRDWLRSPVGASPADEAGTTPHWWNWQAYGIADKASFYEAASQPMRKRIMHVQTLSPRPLTRLALALNPNLTGEYRARLARDGDRLVRAAAAWWNIG